MRKSLSDFATEIFNNKTPLMQLLACVRGVLLVKEGAVHATE